MTRTIGYQRLGDLIRRAEMPWWSMADEGRLCVRCEAPLGPWNKTGWCRGCRVKRDAERAAEAAMECQPSPGNFCNWGGFRSK